MIAPQQVAERSLRRLRRRYALLMLALGAPVLAASVYVLTLQYDIVESGVQRQLAMSAERRVTRFDGVLERMREDVLRLALIVRSPSLLMRDVKADKQALASIEPEVYTLDALPMLLRNVAPQVILVGPAWSDAARREASVERAALFAEQAELVMERGGRFVSVTYVDAAAGEIWIYPWTASRPWLASLSYAMPREAAGRLTRRAGLTEASENAIEGDVRWRVHAGAGDRRVVTVTTPVAGAPGLRFVTADVPLSGLDAARVDAGRGRFWVVDADGQVVFDHRMDEAARSTGKNAAPQRLAAEDVRAALSAPLALEIGQSFVAARPSAIAPWTAFYARDGADVRRLVLPDLWPFVAGAVLVTVLFLAVAAFIWLQFGQPSLRLVDYLRQQAADGNAAEPRVPSDWVPWLQLTRDTFAAWREAAAREQQTEALKSAIVDHALAAVLTIDENGLIVEFNPAAERMSGRKRADVIGHTTEAIVPESLRQAYLEDLRRLRRGEAPQMIGRRVEATALRLDGSEFPVDTVLWRTHVGERTYYTASMYDLSERNAAKKQLERQREALRQAEKLAAMGSLLAGVAHELNNPLAIVMGRASLLEDKCADPDLRADASRIREAAERCGRIVRTFLAMARQRPPQRAAVQLNELVRGAVELLQYNLRTAGVVIEQRLQPELPDVVGDADQLGQVLLNLLVNAQQAVAQVEPPRRVLIETGARADAVWLRVADSGVGVSGEHRERIFDPFVTTKSEGAGTGLGLALSRSIVAEHGGTLQLESASPLGRGASFCIELPVRSTAGRAVVRPAAAQAPAAATMRVLVVDDEPEVTAMMRDALEAAGYEVATAESGLVALALLDESRFDAAVSDLRMPDMDGAALWRAIRARDPELARRFLFVTGDALSPLVSDFRRESGAEGIEKPFTADDLVQRVSAFAAAVQSS